MANLNNWQKLNWVVSRKPFGSGVDGSTTISSDTNSRATLVGNATEFTSTIGSTILSNNDVVMLHQTQGSSAGQWEFNRVSSGGGTQNITWTKALQYTYTTGAQVIKFPMYNTLSVSAHSVTPWDGSKGGIEVICGRTSITLNGDIAGTGGDGFSTSSDGWGYGSRMGFLGGPTGNSSNASYCGEGTAGTWARQSGANGNGGGGGPNSGDQVGAGGGHATAGESKGSATGGSSVGSADLTSLNLGGGGGGSRNDYDPDQMGGGGAGGGAVIFITKTLILNAITRCNGGAGGTPPFDRTGGGGGAGGSILVICKEATLGTNQLVASAGSAGGTGGGTAGAGSVGRIAIHHYTTITGTTNPTFTDVSDTSLREMSGMAQQVG